MRRRERKNGPMLSTCLYCLSRFADFHGRSDRREYWVFSLFQVVAIIGLVLLISLVAAVSGASTSEGSLLHAFSAIVTGLFSLLLFIPTVSVTIRRLHDGGRSGWFLLLCLVPFGVLLLLMLLALPGDENGNEYGPPPIQDQPLVA